MMLIPQSTMVQMLCPIIDRLTIR